MELQQNDPFCCSPFLHNFIIRRQTNHEVKKVESNMLPLGLGMALAQNEAAMKRFESMAEPEKQALIARCHHVKSKREMQQLVNQLTS